MAKMQVIYVRGLGDGKGRGQRLGVALWRIYAVKPHFFPVLWSGRESYAAIHARLIDMIDQLYEQSGQPVGLVGISAGAAEVMNAYAVRKDKIAGVVCVAGKILRPETVDTRLKRHNPAFWEAMQQTEISLEKLDTAARARILSVYSRRDKRVITEDSALKGAQLKVLRFGGHAFTIAWQITFGARKNIHFLKQVSS